MTRKRLPPPKDAPIDPRRAVNSLHKLAYRRGQQLARHLFEEVVRHGSAPGPDGLQHHADAHLANGFTDALDGVLDDARGTLKPTMEHRLLPWLADDIVEHAEEALRELGNGWVSPWVAHADKLRAPGGNGAKLRNLTMGLYRKNQGFDVGRCLTGLNDECRTAAIEMLDGYSRHGRGDLAFVDVAEALMRGEEV